MAAGHKAMCGHCHNPMSLEGRTVCHLPPPPEDHALSSDRLHAWWGSSVEAFFSLWQNMVESFWIFVPRLLPLLSSPNTAVVWTSISKVLSLQERASVAGLVGQVALLGTQAQPPLLNSIRSHKPGSLPPLRAGPRLWTSVFSWLGWEPGLCQRAMTALKNYFALRCFSCHFPKAPSAPPGDHYFPSLKISWDGLRIQPVHLPFSALSQVERWNYSPLVLWPTMFKTKIWSYPALFVLWLLELLCFALFYLNVCFFIP